MSEIRSQATTAREDAKNELATAVLELLNQAAQIGTPGRAITAHLVARGLTADGWLKPRTVTSTSELDALPVGSVVWTPALVGPVGHIFAKCAGMWIIPWHDTAEDPLEQNGSVTVLFTPGDAG
ncbi:hypothetical protein [Rhodococcus qingshengii]|uniref:hypothetical protein n=1 Tax=Rhodococcus qingshengii TaxID=334542 RepID=UPI002AFE2E42|nr:hypothetical protein [Rhodococcus qingshengii]MEA1796688.1 hypothetical protein [Rhodococcus qingshengii]